MKPKSPQRELRSSVGLGGSDCLHPDIDRVFIKWRTRWVKKGIEYWCLSELVDHFLNLPISKEELRAVINSSSDNSAKPAVSKPGGLRNNELPASEVMIERARNKAETVARQLELHPFLKLASRSKPELTDGCRTAIEKAVGYVADKRRKTGSGCVDEWAKLFVGFEPWLLNWWKGDKQKRRITALVCALTPALGHEAAQQRVANPGLSWLRLVALALESEVRLGQSLAASVLVDLSLSCDIEIPGAPRSGDEPQQVGRLCGKIFRDSNTVEVDGFIVARITEAVERDDGNGARESKRYVFSKA